MGYCYKPSGGFACGIVLPQDYDYQHRMVSRDFFTVGTLDLFHVPCKNSAARTLYILSPWHTRDFYTVRAIRRYFRESEGAEELGLTGGSDAPFGEMATNSKFDMLSRKSALRL